MMKITKVIDDNNTIRWYNKDGQYHREDGPAVEWADGDKFWCINGQFHREDGPAIEYASGTKQWWINDQLHREDGPAIEYANGGKSWWINDEELTEEEFNKRTQSIKLMTDLRRQFEEETKASESIDSRYVTWLENQVKVLREKLDKLNQVPFYPNIQTPHNSDEDGLVPYHTICSCNPANGGSGVCGCVMGNKLVSKKNYNL